MTDLTLLSSKEVPRSIEPGMLSRTRHNVREVGGVIQPPRGKPRSRLSSPLTQTLPAPRFRPSTRFPRRSREYFADLQGRLATVLYSCIPRGGNTPPPTLASRRGPRHGAACFWRLLVSAKSAVGSSSSTGPWGCACCGSYWAQSAACRSATHPYRNYLESLVRRPREANQSLTDLLEHLDLANVQMSSFSMLVTLHRSGQARGSVPWQFAWNHIDNNAHDFCEFVQIADGLDKPAVAVSLLEISPKSPFAKAVLIEKDWERARNHIAEWEQDANGSPAILAALAKRYTELGKIEDAQRALTRYIRFSPDYWAYDQLAKSYKTAGDLARWQSTLEEFLTKAEDHGLTHAQVQVELARHFMDLKQWDKAWPYAEAAASSWAQWAMMCARDCAVARKDWKNAETYAERTSRRYTAQAWPYWYLFCLETGQGNLAAARSFAADYVKSINDHPDQAAPGPVGYFYWMGGDTKNAMIWFRNAYEKAPGPYTCFNLILLADEIGDSATREEAIRVLLTNYRRQAPVACEMYQILSKGLNENKPGAVDLNAIDEILGQVPPASRGLNAWLVGLFLKNHGKPEDARRYLKLALGLPGVSEWGQAKANMTLRALGGD